MEAEDTGISTERDSPLSALREPVVAPDALAEGPVRFLLVSGKPIREPIAWYGPIVMNTQDELRIAFDELQQGTFIKAGRPPAR